MKPYPYQEQGIEFLKNKQRVILADVPGLGKTLQALYALEPPALVITPGFAQGVWQDEIKKWTPNYNVMVYKGSPKKRRELALLTHDIVICTYAMMQEVQDIIKHRWESIIFDEAHILRNRRAKTLFKTARGHRDHKTGKSVRGFKSERLFHLTGTPVVNSAADLWTLLNLIDKQRFSSFWSFAERYALVYDNLWTDARVVEGTNPLTAVELQELLGNYMLRRSAEEVGLDLPEKTRQSIPLDMTSKQKKHYQQLMREMMTEIDRNPRLLLAPNKLSQMTRLRQLLVCPRILGIDEDGIALKSLVEEIEPLDEPVVVFTPFAEAIEHIAHALLNTNYSVTHIRGGMSPDLITERIAWINEGGKRVLISTIQMGQAWSATAARIAYFLGFTFSVVEHEQAESRLHRHGQHYPTIMKYLIHEGTIDQHVIDILGRKMSWQRLATDTKKLVSP